MSYSSSYEMLLCDCLTENTIEILLSSMLNKYDRILIKHISHQYPHRLRLASFSTYSTMRNLAAIPNSSIVDVTRRGNSTVAFVAWKLLAAYSLLLHDSTKLGRKTWSGGKYRHSNSISLLPPEMSTPADGWSRACKLIRNCAIFCEGWRVADCVVVMSIGV